MPDAPAPLAAPEIERRLAEHPGWTLADGKLRRTFELADFVAAFGFMTQVAILAQQQDHHPEWSNVYSKVTIELSTHDAGGVTERDFRLLAGIEERWAALR